MRRQAADMGEIVNLRRARKRQAAAKAELESAANRVEFGVSKSVRSRTAAERASAQGRLEAHRRTERRDDD
jgi:Domain of unknown function (DUF4169)